MNKFRGRGRGGGGGAAPRGILAGALDGMSGPAAAQLFLPFFGLPPSTPFKTGILSGVTSAEALAGGPLAPQARPSSFASPGAGNDKYADIVRLLLGGTR